MAGSGTAAEQLRRSDPHLGRTAELTRAFTEGGIDVLIVMRQAPEPDEIGVLREPMLWLGAEAGLAGESAELPLALLDPPCGFRNAATAALDQAGRPYRIAATSPSLSGLRAAVRRHCGDGSYRALDRERHYRCR